MTQGINEAPAPTELDEARRKADQDIEAAAQRDWIRETQQRMERLKVDLVESGWVRRLSDDLFLLNGTKVDFGYAGGKFYVRVYGLPQDQADGPRRLPASLTFYLTRNLVDRQPGWAQALLEVLDQIVIKGAEFWVHFDPSGQVAVGLELIPDGVWFGEKVDVPEADLADDEPRAAGHVRARKPVRRRPPG